MTTTCWICLEDCSRDSTKFDETDRIITISYRDMLKRVAYIEADGKDLLCSYCCSDLKISYNFLLKLDANNKNKIIDESIQVAINDDFVYNTKDPLQSSDEDYQCEEGIELKYDGPCLEEYFKENSDLKECSEYVTAETDFDHEEEKVLLNNLSDLTVSPENLIFPRGRFKCKICDKSYFTTTGLTAHNEVHLPKTLIHKKKRSRRQHKKKLNSVNDCEQSANENLTHIDQFFEQSKMSLPTASKIKSENQIQIKSRKEKQLKPKKTFPCQVCGKHMISASKLRYHMVMHSGEKDYLCSMCPKAYSTIYALKHHFRSHTGDRPYHCKFCDDRFKSPTTLKSHERRHTGERPYGCDICGKRFIQHSSMTTHIKLNHMAKTIPCPHCDKMYARQTDLNTHMLSHTGDKPFPCQLCPSRFIRQANLNKHINQHHSEKSSKRNKEDERHENFLENHVKQEQSFEVNLK